MVQELVGGRKAGGRPREKWFPRESSQGKAGEAKRER